MIARHELHRFRGVGVGGWRIVSVRLESHGCVDVLFARMSSDGSVALMCEMPLGEQMVLDWMLDSRTQGDVNKELICFEYGG